jgi:hypothetical protein
MAGSTFQFSQALNSVNNPSGVFQYGFNNIDDPNFPLGFNLFDAYGFTDGSPLTPAPYPQNKILGWYKTGNTDIDLAIAYQHLGELHTAGNFVVGSFYIIETIGTTDFTLIGAASNTTGIAFTATGNGSGTGTASRIHFDISPQPFPTGGLYVHPIGGVGHNGTKSPVIRITVPYDANFSLNGTIQRATNACGTDIGYSIMKNISTPILNRVNLPTSSTPSTVTVAPIIVNGGDIIDFIIDRGDDLGDSCDDTAIDFNVTFIGLQVSPPMLQGTPDCNSTSLTYDFILQQDGNVSLYLLGNPTPIQTIPIVANGTNGIATFTSLNLTSGGTYYAIATNVGQLDSDPSTNLIISPCSTAIAVDDIVITTANTPITFNVSVNDTLCP